MRVMAMVLAVLGVAGLAMAITPAQARAEAAAAVQALMGYEAAAADGCFHTGNFAGAITILERSILLDPHSVEPYANAAWLAWSLGEKERALDLYQRMIAGNPDDPEGYLQFGIFYMRINDDANALRQLEMAIARGLTSPRRHIYGHILARTGRAADALAFWRRVLTEEPKNGVAQREVQRLEKPATPLK
jgi:tetratricopeptide (TPR) repeat protein